MVLTDNQNCLKYASLILNSKIMLSTQSTNQGLGALPL